jgi:hypothetical protein
MIKFTPYVKQNLRKEIKERVKKVIPFRSGITKAVIITPQEEDPYWVEQQRLKKLVTGK